MSSTTAKSTLSPTLRFPGSILHTIGARLVNMQSEKNKHTSNTSHTYHQSVTMVSGERLVLIMRSEMPPSQKLGAITDLKTHIKTRHVDMSQVHSYIEALSLAVEIPDQGILSNSFSTLSHLVKRISIQDLTGSVLEAHASTILPQIITRLGDSRTSSRTAAKNALEAFWLLRPAKVEEYLRDVGLQHRNTTIATQCVSWLRGVIDMTPHFKLTTFLPVIVLLLAKNLHSLQSEVVALLQSYYKLKHNKIFQIDLLKECDKQHIPQEIQTTILPEVAPHLKTLSNSPKLASYKPARSNSARAPISSRPPSRASSSLSRSSTLPPQASDSRLLDKVATSLNDVIALLPGYQLDTKIPARNVSDHHDLHDQFHSIAFQGKETEFNWNAREKYVVNLRSIIRGNAMEYFQEDTIAGFKQAHANIIKAISSLRTTLSTNGCQLVKEVAILLGVNIDPLIDLFMVPLMKLCSSTKSFASNNANIALCAMFANFSFNPKVIARALMASLEKNALPRSFCGIWLQIFVTRFRLTLNQAAQGHPTVLDMCMATLVKTLKDPNPAVRTSAKAAFWTFESALPGEAQVLLSKLDSNTLRALQRSKPQVSKFDFSTVAKEQFSQRASSSIPPELRESTIKLGQTVLNNFPRALASNAAAGHHTESKTSSERTPMAHNVELRPAPFENMESKQLEKKQVERLWNRNLKLSPDRGQRDVPEIVNPVKHQISPVQQTSPARGEDKDIILNFLSSLDDTILSEGVGLLKFAMIAEEQLSDEFPLLLTKISNRDPSKLERLFTVNDDFYKRSFALFSLADYLRLSFAFIETIDEKFVLFMISRASLEDLFDGIIRILSYTTDRTNITEGDGVLRQIIKFKQRLWTSILDFLNLSLDKLAISDGNFRMLLSGLFEIFLLVQHTPLYDSMVALLKKLYPINRGLFTSELQQCSPSIIQEVEKTVGIDNTLSLSNGQEHTQYTSVLELTKVNPMDVLSRLSPVKDFDNISSFFEAKRADRDGDCEMSDEQPEVAPTLEAAPLLTFEHLEVHRDDKDRQVFEDVFAVHDESHKSDMFAKISKSGTPSSGLVDGLALVQISEHGEDRHSLIQDFIEKVDPLKQMSSKRRSVSIYEDKSGSPQKPSGHSYSTPTWFNFQVAKSKPSPSFIAENDLSHFQDLCYRIREKQVDGQDFMYLLGLLQTLGYRGSEFVDYFHLKGLDDLVSSLWIFLSSPDPITSHKLQSLIILKQLLVNQEHLDMQRLWHSLVNLSEDATAQSEIYHGIREAFDEMNTGLYAKQELLAVVVHSASEELNQWARVFVFDCLFKTLNASSNASFWTNSLLLELDDVLRPHITSSIVDIRRYVMLCYGILHKIGRRHAQRSPDRANYTVLDGMTNPQQKLVSYYSQV